MNWTMKYKAAGKQTQTKINAFGGKAPPYDIKHKLERLNR